ncbi:hypothetical protein GW931_00160, partial [archaeon]|nr:hypothetical protein [archaeon]
MKKRSAIAFSFIFLIAVIILSTNFVSATLTCGTNEQSNYIGCGGYYYSSSPGTYDPNGACLAVDAPSKQAFCSAAENAMDCADVVDANCAWTYTRSCNNTYYPGNEGGCISNSECFPEYQCACVSGTSWGETGTTVSGCTGTYTYSAGFCDYTNSPPAQKTSPVCYGNGDEASCEDITYCTFLTQSGTAECSYRTYPDCPTGCSVSTVPTYGCIANQCTDSDSPSIDSTSYTNYTKKGTVTGATTGVNGTDSCSGNVLTEHFCSTTNVGSTTTFNCATLGTGYTCSDGACVSPQTLTCTDTDS